MQMNIRYPRKSIHPRSKTKYEDWVLDSSAQGKRKNKWVCFPGGKRREGAF